MWIIVAAALVPLALVSPATALAQAEDGGPAWLTGIGIANYALAEEHGTGWGPEAVVRRRLGPVIVVQARVTVIPTSSGFYDFGGAAVDLGVGVLVVSGNIDVALVAGASALGGGDSDGSYYTAGGAHLMAQATGWLSRAVGLYGNVATRLMAGSGADYGLTSGAAGLAFRF